MEVNSWAQHYQTVWHERAGDPRLPYWLRIAALAYGQHRANGHAQFEQGQIALILGRVDQETGEVHPMDKNNLQRALRQAIQFGWLKEDSGATCLVVPGHAITGGLGDRSETCPQHRTRRKRQKREVGQNLTHLRAVSGS